MESAFGIDHGEISKAGFPSMKLPGSFKPQLPKAGKLQGAAQNFGAGLQGRVGGARRAAMPNQQSRMFGAGQRTRGAMNRVSGMSTGAKVTVGGSLAAGAGVGAYNKKKTGRLTGNGGLVGMAARKQGWGYDKR